MPSNSPRGSLFSGLLARLRSLWRGIRQRRDVEAEMLEEFRHHLELRTRDLIRDGLPPREAARRARIEFGHIETHREAARAARGLHFVDQLGFSWLDVKLGVRMLRKYPGLSLVSVIGMAVAIAVGAGGFGFLGAMMDPTLPLPEGERVVSIQNNDTRNSGAPDRRLAHDFALWRSELTSVRDLSAFTSDQSNLLVPGEGPELVRVARMTAAGFRVARVAPVLGRALVEEDEREGSPPVLVIAYEEWQSRFGGSPEIIGQEVRLGTTVCTIVGVMPEGFRFPINHRYWIPLRIDPAANPRGEGPSINVFGRLVDGVSLEQAQAQLTTIGARLAASYPETHARLRPVVLPYTLPFLDVDSPSMRWIFRLVQVGLSLLLVVVAANVGILIYARTATRTGEIAVRSALGASRRRLVTQLFAEALVMAVVAATIGLTIAAVALEGVQAFQERVSQAQLPFWLDLGLSPGLVLYAAGLAVLAGVIVGVLPALKATGRGLRSGLQDLPSRGSRMRLGRTWTTLIVAQVALAVAPLPFSLYVSVQGIRHAVQGPGYPVGELLEAWLSIEREEAPARADAARYEAEIGDRFLGSASELLHRIRTEPGVAGVAVGRAFPGGEGYTRIEVEGSGTRRWTRVNDVDVGLFGAFGVPIVAGRGFRASDSVGGPRAVIVDRVFADQIFPDGNVLGRRVRQVAQSPNAEPGAEEEGPWMEIVGVVPDFTPETDFDPPNPTFYRPAPLTSDYARGAVALSVRTRPGTPPASFARRLSEIAAAVDPALQLHELRTGADAERERRQLLLSSALAIVAITGSVLLLSAAGIYAMMSFTVARRRREIGIRAALGAEPLRVLSGIFRRATLQLGAGVLTGLVLALAAARILGIGVTRFLLSADGVLLLSGVAALMMVIGLLAALGPARRGLAVQPTEALREE